MGLFQSILDYYGPIIFQNARGDQSKYEQICKSFEFLEKFLEGENYVAGKNMTLEDLALVSALSTSKTFGYDLSSFKNVSQWYQRIKKEAFKFEEINSEFIKGFKELVASLKK